MLTVYKYRLPIPPKPPIELELPKDAQITHFAFQGDQPCIWALVDTEAPLEKRYFRFVGTGHQIHETWNQLSAGASCFVNNGEFVFHLFEIIN